MTCDEAGPDVVALAFGALSAGEAANVEAHLASCEPCRAELAASKRLVCATRDAPAAEPPAGGLDRLLVAFRAERDAGAVRAVTDVPPPAAMRRSRRARILSFAIPLAAAASILVAVVLRSQAHEARVLAGSGFFIAAGAAPDAGLALRDGSAEFEFAEGDEIASGAGKLSVRIDLEPGTGATAPDRPPPGRVELTLQPGARIVRRSSADLDLVAGAVVVVAGPLAEPLTIHAGTGYATVKGTRFTAWTTESRLVVAVAEGTVDLGRDDGPSESLTAGEEGLVDAQRLLERSADGHRPGEGFLTPRAHVRVEAAPEQRPGDPVHETLHVWLDVGDGGPVSILPFDDSEPRFLLRLKGDDGRVREVKLQRAMLEAAAPAVTARTWRLDTGRAYDLAVEPKALGLTPGRYEASLRYMSYRARSDGAEWLGVVESDPVTFEVPAR